MKGTRYWSWREKKRKKRTKRTQPQWYSLLWFHHRRVDSIWVRIIKDCLSFSRREKHQLQIPPIPSTRSRSSPLPVTLSRLSLLPGQYLSGPNYSPPPRGKTGKTWRRHWIVSTSSFSPGFSNASFFFSRFFFLFFLLSPFVSLFATRVRVFRFTERVSRDITPAFFRSSFFLARSLLLPFFRGTLCPGNRANQSFRNERRRRRRFSRLRLFLCRCCRLSTPLGT